MHAVFSALLMILSLIFDIGLAQDAAADTTEDIVVDSAMDTADVTATQPEPPNPLVDASRNPGPASDTADLNALVVIGKAPDKIRKLPGTATRLDTETLELLNPLGTQEALQRIPGVHGFSDDGFGNSRLSIGVRGLNPRRSSRILILEDGVPIQPALYLYPNMYYNPPTERLDEIEMIKGSAAVQYGPQTMGGVINYITRRPRPDFGGSVQLMGGENGYFSAFGEVGGFGNDYFLPEVQMLYKRGDGFRENNSLEQLNGTFKATYAPSEERLFYFKANGNYENTNATYTGLTEYSFENNPDFNPKKYDNFEVHRFAVDLLQIHEISSSLSENTLVYGSWFNRDWWRETDVFVRADDAYFELGEINPVAPATPGNLLRVGNGRNNLGILREFYTVGLARNYTWSHSLMGRKAELNAGARVHWERFEDDKKMGSGPGAREGVYYFGDVDSPQLCDDPSPAAATRCGQSHHYETLALSLHALESVTLGDLTLSPGIRFEIFEQERIDRLRGSRYLDNTAWVVLPGIGLNYALGPVNLFGGVHRGYTPPSSGTLNVVKFGDTDGGLDVKPEQSWNYEAGLRGNVPWIGFEIAGFFLDIEDVVAAGRGTAFNNLGSAITYGAEVAADFRPGLWIPYFPSFHATYTYLQTEITEGIMPSNVQLGTVSVAGNELPYAPQHSVLAGISEKLPGGVTLRFESRYLSRVYTDFENIEKTSNRGDTGPIPAYLLFDAAAEWRAGDNLRIFVNAKNLLDESYIGSRLHSNPGQTAAHESSGIMPGAGRQINAGAAVTF